MYQTKDNRHCITKTLHTLSFLFREHPSFFSENLLIFETSKCEAMIFVNCSLYLTNSSFLRIYMVIYKAEVTM